MKKHPSAILVTLLCCACLAAACSTRKQNPVAATPSPTPQPAPLIAYLNEGNLWMIAADGSGKRLLAATPEGETIQDFIWAADGTRIYFSIGTQFFEVVLQSGNIASAGELNGPPGATVDRLELARDGKTFIVHALDADAASRTLALEIGQSQAREIGIDEYTQLAPARPPTIRALGEMSVSPDARRILFKDSVGTGEELFISDVETGARIQLTNLYELAGFEESVETEGGRRVIEAAWSPDGRYVVFNPMQSCSELGLCYGRLFLVEAWGGAQLQLSLEMMVNVPVDWTPDGKMLVYDDGSRVVVTETSGNPKALAEGNHPKWQPMP